MARPHNGLATLSILLLLLAHNDHQAVLIIPAVGTRYMRKLGVPATRAYGKGTEPHLKMGRTLIPARLGKLMFGNGHETTPPSW